MTEGSEFERGSIAKLFTTLDRREPPPVAGEGLRDRKKRELRQRISDTATGMFLDRGFDEVTVSEIAEACDVSEKTIYNYFPTKESLIFDREADQARQIAEALRDRGDGVSIIDSILAVLEAEVRWMYTAWIESGIPKEGLTIIRQFGELIENTPALSAGAYGMWERLSDVAATTLAERAGVDPEDPEPQMAATIVMGLWRTQFRAMQRYAAGVIDDVDVAGAVIDDLRRAAAVAATGLSSFDAVVRANTTKDQLKDAVDAADQARKQVVAAMKQARTAWRHVMTEVQAHHQAHHDLDADERSKHWTAKRETQREMRERQQELRAEIRQYQQELRRQRGRQRGR